MRVRTHPGEIIKEEFLPYLGLSLIDLSEKLNITEFELHSIIIGTKDIDDAIAEKLGEVFGSSKEFWLNLQKGHDDSK